MTIGRVFVTSNQLREKLASVWNRNKLGKDLRILDSSYDFDEQNDGYKDFYQQGHIQSSLYFNPLQCSKKTPFIPFDLPNVNRFTEYVQSLGVSPDTHIITYDRLQTRAALRTWWLFRLYGHRNISVLDGGLKKWVRDGYHISTEEPTVERGSFEAQINPALMKNYNSIKDRIPSKMEELIDVRGSEAFNKTIDRENGEKNINYIPGSKNLPYKSFFNDDGTFKSPEDIKQLCEKANIDTSLPWIGTCARGITACAVLAAADILGKPDTPLYYGSWYEWSRRMSQ